MLTEMCFKNRGFLYEFTYSIGPSLEGKVYTDHISTGKLFGFLSTQTSTLDYFLFEGCFELLADVLKAGQPTHYLKDGFIYSLDSDLNYYITVDVEICLRPTGYSKLLL